MKVTVKTKEPNAFEKRDTSIITFSLVAVIPLLFCIFLGFSLGQTDEINKKNMVQKLEATKQELATLQAELEASQKSLEELKNVFYKADTLLQRFKKEDVKKLEEKLAIAELEYDFNDWDNDQRGAIEDFKNAIDRVEKPLDFENDTLGNLLSYGKNWLTEFLYAKKNELSNRKLVKMQDTGNSITQALQMQIMDLKNQLTLKDVIIEGMKGSQNTKAESKSQTDTELNEMKQKAATAKEKINVEVSWIRDNIVVSMRGRRWLTNNEDEMQQLKSKLESRLISIQTHLNELK